MLSFNDSGINPRVLGISGFGENVAALNIFIPPELEALAAVFVSPLWSWGRWAAKGGRRSVPFGYELLAAFLLTGGRESEVLRLEVDDVSLDRGAARLQTLDQGARVSV